MENVEVQKIRKVKAVCVPCCSRWLAVVNKWQSTTSHSCFQCCTTAYKGTTIPPPSCGHIKYWIRNTFAFLWWIIFHGILLVLECLFLRCVRRDILKSTFWIPQDSSGTFWLIFEQLPQMFLSEHLDRVRSRWWCWELLPDGSVVTFTGCFTSVLVYL